MDGRNAFFPGFVWKRILPRGLAWIFGGLSIIFYIIELILRGMIPLAKLGAPPGPWPVDIVGLGFITYAMIGALVALRRPENPVGWIFLVTGFTGELNAMTGAYVSFMKLTRPGEQMIPPGVLWLPSLMWIICFLTPLLLLYYFPTGQLPSRRWRLLIWIMAAGLAAGLVRAGYTAQAGANQFELPSLLSLLKATWLVFPLENLFAVAMVVVLLGGIWAIVLRFMRSRGEERLQLKWFTYAGVLAVLSNMSLFVFFDTFARFDPTAAFPATLFWGIPETLAYVILPAAAAVAILRYRLYEIDIIIRKTLIYASLTGILVLVYTAVVLFVENALAPLTRQVHSDVAIVISTLTIATLFTPLRRGLQSWIDRRFFRDRYNAEQVLARFSTTARNEVDLEQIREVLMNVVIETMQPDHVLLWIRPERNKTRSE